MVRNSVWGGAGFSNDWLGAFFPRPKSRSVFLCVGCLETRLGRTLCRSDFERLPANEIDPLSSERLIDRLRRRKSWPLGQSKAKKLKPWQLLKVLDKLL